MDEKESFSTKLFHMAVDLLGSKTEDNKEEANKIINDLLLLSLKTDRNYGKCEKVFHILYKNKGFIIDLRIKDLWIYYDIKALVCGGPCTVLGQIICSKDIKQKSWDIRFARFNGVSHHKVLDKCLPEIREVMDIREH